MGNMTELDFIANDFIFYHRRKNKYSISKTCEIKNHREEYIADKYYEREYTRDDPDNDLGLLVRKQVKALTREKEYTIAIVLEREFINPLMAPDQYFYYLIKRPKLTIGWGRTLNLKGYERARGFYLPFYILQHVDKYKAKDQSELVMYIQELEVRGLYRCPMAKIIEYEHEHNLPVLINAYGSKQTPIPFTMMEKILDYDNEV